MMSLKKIYIHNKKNNNIVENKLQSVRKHRDHKGFTLVEIVVIITILSIIAAISVFGILGWIDWTNFKRQNEYAQTLFVSAQNQLTDYAQDKKLGEFKSSDSYKWLHDSNENYRSQFVLDVTNITSEEGQKYDLTAVFKDSKNKSDAGNYQTDIITLRCKKGDYQKYQADQSTTEVSDDAKLMFDILQDYVFDKTILDAAIALEFTPDEGQVFSVCYSDKDNAFVYSNGLLSSKETEDLSSKRMDISSREEGYRQDRMVGYYGVDTLSKSTYGNGGKPSLASVQLNNQETLNLSYRVTKYPAAAQSLTYNITVYDKESKTPRVMLSVNGTKLKGMDSDADNNLVDCDVYAYNESGSIIKPANDSDQAVFPVCAWIEGTAKNPTVRIILDAADLQAQTDLFISEYNMLGANGSKPAFSNTMSFHRFGVNSQNIYCTVDGKGNKMFKSTVQKKSNAEATYFASAADKKETVTGQSGNAVTRLKYDFGIENARHLYNMRYIEDLSLDKDSTVKIRNAEFNLTDGDQFEVVYTQKKNIDFVEFEENGNLYNTYQNTKYVDTSKFIAMDKLSRDNTGSTALIAKNAYFPSFKSLQPDHTYDGKDKVISNLTISLDSNIRYGLFKDQFEEKDGKFTLDTDKETVSTGLFLVNYGTLSNLSLDQVVVKGKKRVGGFCGTNAGKIDNATVLNTSYASTISGLSNVGGIMGYQAGVNNENIYEEIEGKKQIIIQNLENNAKVLGNKCVGGIVGMLQIRSKEEGTSGKTNNDLYIQVKDCDNYGPVLALELNEIPDYEYTLSASESAEQDKQNQNLIESLEKNDPDNTDDTTSGKGDESSNSQSDAIDLSGKPAYIGGITGYCYNGLDIKDAEEKSEHITLKNCISSPQYSDKDLAQILKSLENDEAENAEEGKEEVLKGYYVGGIAGYNYFSQIANCSTKAQPGQTGYVFGYCYVGGIVGYNQGPASGIDGDGNKGTLLAAKTAENNANVIGARYVGGITGCNADIVKDEDETLDAADVDSDILILPDNTPNLNVKISNWINKGVIVATKQYAGGITGYNAGWIYNCNSDVENNESAQNFSKTQSGDYAGGIAGYNSGIIGNTNRDVSLDNMSKSTVNDSRKAEDKQLSAVSYVTGKNYVGGIVGYNDSSAIVEDYTLAGGYIYATDNFAGGYAGINLAATLLMDTSDMTNPVARQIYANPNKVIGKYFVGGSIGGNIISARDEQCVDTLFQTNNFLGNIKGDAFVGGFIGYNLMMTPKENKSTSAIAAEVIRCTQDLPTGEKEDLYAITNKLDHLNDNNVLFTNSDKNIFTISGKGEDTTQNKFGDITARIYVGGVVGYCDAGTYLVCKNIVNVTPIVATDSIENDNEQILDGNKKRTTDYNGENFTYSYAGGIIGKVGQNCKLYRCKNADVGSVESQGTYTGGLCEINEGTVEQCSVSSLGSNAKDYVGGIAGLNEKTGTILSCDFDSQTVSGRNFVGGFAAENFGKINGKNMSLVKPVIASDGDQAGCITGYNYETGIITLYSDLKDVRVDAAGDFTGAVCGTNAGNIKSNKKDKNDKQVNLIISGSVQADSTAGGLVGSDISGKTIQYITNNAIISADNGKAGGIVGSVLEKTTIQNCLNTAKITAKKSGNAGGIVSLNNKGQIQNCIDTGEVIASNGNSGGITAENSGTIKDCVTKYDSSSASASSEGDKKLGFTSIRYVGGICAENKKDGQIEGCKVENLSIQNTVKKNVSGDKVHIGGLVGMNEGRIMTGENCVIGTVITSRTDKINMGVMVGTNAKTGIIESEINTAGSDSSTGSEGGASVSYAENQIGAGTSISFTGTYANVGGVAGTNAGTISRIDAVVDITGTHGLDDYGYGGIAGINKGKISSCSYTGDLKVEGQASNIANIGGMTGKNFKDGLIEGSYIGKTKDHKMVITSAGSGSKAAQDSAYAYAGGMAGWNLGQIISCPNAEKSLSTVEIIGYKGFTGGITGFEADGAVIAGTEEARLSSGKNWTVYERRIYNDCGLGGIIGLNESGEDMQYVDNWAKVEVGQEIINSDKTYAGGFIGRSQNKYVLTTKYSNCVNYGDVISFSAGGFIGRLKYKAIDFENCVNYGRIDGKMHSAGGILAGTYGIDPGCDISFTNCKNFGEIYSNVYTAGIMAKVESGMLNSISFVNCVNEGTIVSNQGQQQLGGIFGCNDVNAASEMQFIRCRNYGNGVTSDNSKNPYFYGITNTTNTRSMVECFSIANTQNITNMTGLSSFKRNYYLDYNRDADKIETEPDPSEGETEDKEDVDLSNIVDTSKVIVSINGKTRNDGTMKYVGGEYINVYDGRKEQFEGDNTQDIALRLEWNRKACDNGKLMKFDFSALPQNISGFQILMASNNNTFKDKYRSYEYTTTVEYEDGVKINDVVTKDTIGKKPAEGTFLGERFTDKNLINITCDKTKKVKSITVNITKIYSSTNKNNLYVGDTETKYVCFWGAWAYIDEMPDIQSCKGPSVGSIDTNPGLIAAYNWKQAPIEVDDNNQKWKIKGEGNFVLENISPEPEKSFTENSVYLRPEEVTSQNSKKDRQNVYESIEEGVGDEPSEIEKYYQSLHNSSADPNSISIKKAEMSGGTILCDWNLRLDDLVYESSELVYIVKDRDGNEIASNKEKPYQFSYGEHKFRLKPEENWVGCTITFYVRACGINYDSSQYGVENYPATGKTQQKYTSSWTSKEMTVLETLTMPKVHIELVDANKFMAVLDNPQDYEGKENIKINIKVQNTNVPLYPEKGNKSDLFEFKSLETTTTVSAQAINNSSTQKYSSSIITTNQVSFYGTDQLKGTVLYTAAFSDFYGDLPDNLENSITLQSKHNYVEEYVNSELEIEKYNIGEYQIPLVVSNGTSHITFAATQALGIRLGNIPESMLMQENKVTVRSYIWKSQSYIVHYGHEVMMGLSEDELINYLQNPTTCVDDKRGEMDLRTNPPSVFSVENGKVTLNPGYIVRLTENGKYDILYSTFLNYSSENPENDPVFDKQIYEKVYAIAPSTEDTKGTVIATKEQLGSDLTDNVQSKYSHEIFYKPTIDSTCEYTDNSYPFSWTLNGETDKNSDYMLKLYGINVDPDTGEEERILLDSAQTKENNYTFTNPEMNWNYPKLVLQVVKRGTMGTDEKTKIFPSVEEKTFAIKQKFSKISKPTVAFSKDKNGNTQKNALDYDVTWSPIPKAEIASKELKAYEVSVDFMGHDQNVVKPYEDKDSYDKALADYKSLYGKKAGVADSDAASETDEEGRKVYTYSWTENDVDKEMRLICDETNFSIQRELTERYYVYADASGKAATKAQIKLDDYARGDTVAISVKAVAIDDAKAYRDGPDGVSITMKLPSRLDVPDVSVLAIDDTQKYDIDSFITADILKKGLNMNYKPAMSSINAMVSGKYEIAVALYEEKPEDAETDKAKHSSEEWCKDSKVILASKSETAEGDVPPAIVMNGDFYDASSVLAGIDGKYAGMWLKIAMRSISDSNISSVWSDEDEAEDKTQNYRWIQIPRLQLMFNEAVNNNTALQMGTIDQYYDMEEGTVSQTNDPGTKRILNKELTFPTCDNADGYMLQILGDEQEIEPGTYTRPVTWVYIEKQAQEAGDSTGEEDSNSVYAIFSAAANAVPGQDKPENDNPEGADQTETAICRQNASAQYLGQITALGDTASLTQAEIVEIPDYTGNTTYTEIGESVVYPVTFGSRITYQEGRFTLVLPDVVEGPADWQNYRTHFTTSVSMQAVAIDSNKERYENSLIENFMSLVDEDGTETDSLVGQIPETGSDAPVIKDFKLLEVINEEDTNEGTLIPGESDLSKEGVSDIAASNEKSAKTSSLNTSSNQKANVVSGNNVSGNDMNVYADESSDFASVIDLDENSDLANDMDLDDELNQELSSGDNLPSYVYSVTADGYLVAKVVVYDSANPDEDGNIPVIETRMIVASGKGISDIENTFTLTNFPYFDLERNPEFASYQVYVSFAKITADTGISAWTEETLLPQE